MFKNLKKLKKLLENYDKIMLLIDKVDDKKLNKRHSVFNTPRNQLELIEKLKGGEK